jgi:quinol monooxygenase YgiN
MTGETVRIVARITSRPEKLEEVRSILLGLVERTRTEKGCISYQLLQDKNDPREFCFIEEWTDDSAIDAHLMTPHLQDAFSRVKSLLAGDPDIRRYLVIG